MSQNSGSSVTSIVHSYPPTTSSDPRLQHASSAIPMKVPRKANNISNISSSPQDPRTLVSTISTTVIPTSSHQHPKENHYKSQSKGKMPPLNLPDGVSLPPTMDPTILFTSDRAMTLMNELNPSQVQAALNEFDEAMRNKGGKVRNAQAYLVGVIKRYLHVNRKERSSVGAPSMGQEVTPVVKVTLQKLIDSNFCTQVDLSNNVMAKLKMLSEHDALLAINEISSVQRSTIRNFASYFMGILNRYMRGEDRGGGRIAKNKVTTSHYKSNGGGLDSQYNDGGRRGNSRRSRKDDDPDRHRRSHSSYDSDYSDDRGRRRSSRRGGRRGRNESDDDVNRSSSSDREYHRSRRRRRDRDRSRSASQDRYRDKYDSRGRRSRRSRSRSRSRSPYNRKDRESHRSSSRRSHGNNVMVNPASVVPPFPGASIPPPPPPPPPRNLQGQQQPPPQWQNPQTSFAQPPPMINNGTHPQFQNPQLAASNNYGQMSTVVPPSDLADILGIAEKATAAVQALSNTRQQHQHTVVPQPITQYVPQPSSYPPANRFQQQEKQVKVTDLSPMIQYSITNLKATGMLDKELGDNACRLLKNMHESVALQALEKFSSCDGNTMRSKEGYLIGILRKAAGNS